MPTYDYECDGCKHTFEEFQSMKDEPLTKCPKCKKKKLRRLLGTGAAIIFKGSGFYQTDYRSDSYKSSAKADEAKSNEKCGTPECPCAPADTAGKSGAAKPAATDSPKKTGKSTS
jgi:putative FmdB family regulatory protein